MLDLGRIFLPSPSKLSGLGAANPQSSAAALAFVGLEASAKPRRVIGAKEAWAPVPIQLEARW